MRLRNVVKNGRKRRPIRGTFLIGHNKKGKTVGKLRCEYFR